MHHGHFPTMHWLSHLPAFACFLVFCQDRPSHICLWLNHLCSFKSTLTSFPDSCSPAPIRIKPILLWVPWAISVVALLSQHGLSLLLGPFRLGWCHLCACFRTHQLEAWTTASREPGNLPGPLLSYLEALSQTSVLTGGACAGEQGARPFRVIISASFWTVPPLLKG